MQSKWVPFRHIGTKLGTLRLIIPIIYAYNGTIDYTMRELFCVLITLFDHYVLCHFYIFTSSSLHDTIKN